MANLSSPVLEEYIHGKQPDMQNPYEKYVQLQILHSMLDQFGISPGIQKQLDNIDNICKTACGIAINTRGCINELHSDINPDMIPKECKQEKTPNSIIAETLEKFQKPLAHYTKEQILLAQHSFIASRMSI